MAVRTDVAVDWSASPRIIEIAAPSTEIIMQDLVDTCRNLETELNALDNEHLLNASGKEDLGGGVYVGITVELQNAKLKFEDRAGSGYIQCDVSGGNLVAVDINGDSMNPIEPSNFTQIIKTSSSSATLQELTSIQHSSFNGGVAIDVDNGISGTTFPIGTSEQPENNLTDAQTIATDRGFDTLYIKGDITFGATDVLENHKVIGQGQEYTTITLISGCSTEGTLFRNASITGEQSGETHYHNCEIDTLSNVHCIFIECRIVGDITMHPTSQDTSFLIRCYSGVAGLGTPVIDINNGKMNMAFRAYSGGIKFKNSSDSAVDVSLDFTSGQIILDSTITAGTFVVRGNCKITDNSEGATIDRVGAINPSLVWDESDAKRLLGLMHENVYFDNPTYDGNGNLNTMRMRTYSVANSVGSNNDVLATYDVIVDTTSMPKGKFVTFKTVKV